MPVRVAVVGPFSGPRAAWGQLLLDGMAAVPHAGVRWVTFDDQGDTSQAVARAVEVIADGGFAAVLGHFNSLGAARALPLYRAAAVPVLLPLATAPGLAEPADVAIPLCPDDNGQAEVIARACRESRAGAVTVVHDGTEYGQRLAERIRDAAGGVAVSVYDGWPAGRVDGTVVLCGSHHRVGALLRERPVGDGPVLVTDDCDVPEFAELAGTGAVGVRVARIAGGPLARVVAGFAAVAAALRKYPERRGTELLEALRGEVATGVTAPAGWQVTPLARAPHAGRYDVAVLGAGVVGLATAALLAEAGARVALVTGDAPETAASAVSGALVRAFALDPAERERSTRSFQMLWGRPDLGPWYGFRGTGALVLLGATDLDPAAAGVAALREAGVDAALLTASKVARRWPDVDTAGLAGAVWEPGGGYVSAAVALAALRDRALRAGVALYAGRRAIGPLAGDGPVELADGGRLHAARIVVTAGCGSPGLLGEAWPADRRARTRLIRYGIFAGGGRALPTIVDSGTGMWGRPDGGDGFLAGCPVPEWNVPVSAGTGLTDAQVEQLRLGVSGRLPFLAKADLLTGRYGTDLFVTGGPVVGRVPGTDRLFVAAGWSGAGFKTAPAAAAQVAAALEIPPPVTWSADADR